MRSSTDRRCWTDPRISNRPADKTMSQRMRPDTRSHRTVCANASQGRKQQQIPHAGSVVTAKPLRGSSATLRPWRMTATTDPADQSLWASPLALTRPTQGPKPGRAAPLSGEPAQETIDVPERQKEVAFPEASTHTRMQRSFCHGLLGWAARTDGGKRNAAQAADHGVDRKRTVARGRDVPGDVAPRITWSSTAMDSRSCRPPSVNAFVAARPIGCLR